MSTDGKAKWSKRIVSLIGLLVLGAIGNGVWSGLMAPALEWVRDIILTTASLGVDSFRDGIYLEAAKGFNERIADDIHVWLLNFFIVIGVFICVGLILTGRRLERLANDSEEDEAFSPSRVERLLFRSDVTPSDIVALRRISYTILPIFVLAMAFTVTRSVTIEYVNHAVTHYRQLIDIMGDNLSDNDRRVFGSRFAQIQTRAEFVAIITELESKARATNLYVPRFSIW